MRLTVDEILLVAFILSALLLGAGVKHYRDAYRAAHPVELQEKSSTPLPR